MNDKETLDKIEMSGNQYGGFTPVWQITISVLRITTSVLTVDKIYEMNGNQCGGFTTNISFSIEQGKYK